MREKVVDSKGRVHKLRAAKNVRLNRSRGGDISIAVILTCFGFLMAIPMIYAISQSLKPLDELWMFPPRFLVRNPTLKNFSDLFSLMSSSWVPVSRYIFNTVLISFVGTGGHLVFASMAAYALSKHKFRGRTVIFETIVLSLMFSTAVTAVPNFLIISKLGMMNTYWALILPGAISAYNLILMRNFVAAIPPSLEEAAYIDGANELQILWKVIVPLCKPALATFTLFHAVGHWNGYFNATMYINSRDKWPLVAESGTSMVHQSATAIEDLAQPFTLQMAIIIFTIIPILCVYPFVQKYFMKGMLMGSVKG